MNDKVKLIVAVACLSVAALVIAWQMGLFGGSGGGSSSDGAGDFTERETDVEVAAPSGNAPTGVTIGGGAVRAPEFD